MDVDVYKLFASAIKNKYLKDTYFVDNCFNYISKYSEESNLNNFRLRIFLEENNVIKDGCDSRKYCDMNFLKGIELSSVSGVVKPFNKTYIEQKEINYITTSDVWDIEEF